MSRPETATANRVLVVEGSDERHVVWRLCQRCQPALSFQIEQKGGIDTLLDDLGPDILAPGRQTVGIVVDANADVSARWTAVRNRLLNDGVHIPYSPAASGTVIAAGDGKPRIGVWIMPDNGSTGELEDFVVQMIPTGDQVWPLSQAYIDGIPEPAFSQSKTLRAQLYAWLATREDPRQMGLAIRARDLNVNGALCRRFAGWLARLFA